MPYILSPHIHPNLPGLWGEGSPYSRDTVYDINSNDPAQPPVNYQSHLLKPHSIPHIDAEGHITRGGKTVDAYYEQSACSCFYGKTVVVKLRDAAWEQTDLGGATHTLSLIHI